MINIYTWINFNTNQILTKYMLTYIYIVKILFVDVKYLLRHQFSWSLTNNNMHILSTPNSDPFGGIVGCVCVWVCVWGWGGLVAYIDRGIYLSMSPILSNVSIGTLRSLYIFLVSIYIYFLDCETRFGYRDIRWGGGGVTQHLESSTSHIFLDPKVPLATFVDTNSPTCHIFRPP